jgi:hypothetical protein
VWVEKQKKNIFFVGVATKGVHENRSYLLFCFHVHIQLKIVSGSSTVLAFVKLQKKYLRKSTNKVPSVSQMRNRQ